MNEINRMESVGFIAYARRPSTKSGVYAPCGIFKINSPDHMNNTVQCLFEALYCEYPPEHWEIELFSFNESVYLQKTQQYNESLKYLS